MTKPLLSFLKACSVLLLCALAAASHTYAQTKPKPRRTTTGKPAARKIPQAKAPASSNNPARDSGAEPRQINSSMTVRWTGQPGITRYRLQLATDEAFTDIVFDEAVVGRQHVVRTLPPGKYFWRVAPAVGETGVFSTPAQVSAVESAPGPDESNVLMPPANTGWRTATGEVSRPVPAQLRAGKGFDLIGVNTNGMVFALDGANGFALWTARYKLDAQRGTEPTNIGTPLSPAIVRASAETPNVVVGFDEGIRALRGDSGKEVWRAKLSGRAVSTTVADIDGDGKLEIVVVTADPSMLYVIDGEWGRIASNTKLDANPFGAAVPIVREKDRGMLLGLVNGALEMRSASGSLIHSTKFDTALTTPPIALATPRGQIIAIGTEAGIVALKDADLTPLGRISTRDDAPRGILTAADLDDDGATELIVVTRGGRVAVVSTIDGNTKWFAEGAVDAASASVADLNGDGVLDVIVPAGASFARGFSGRDGSLIWKVEEESGRDGGASPTSFAPRSLAVAPTGESSGGVIVGSDPARTGLRAVELPKGSVKTAAK